MCLQYIHTSYTINLKNTVLYIVELNYETNVFHTPFSLFRTF